MLIAQLSDLHIKAGSRKAYGIVDTAAMLKAAIVHLLAFSPRPDVVLITGDLVDHGSAEDYQELCDLLSPLSNAFRERIFLLPGNHDEREALRRAFPEHRYLAQDEDFAHYAVMLAPRLRLLALDTVVPEQSHGELCERRLRWLGDRLSEEPIPTLIAMHHPPFVTGIEHMDVIGLRRADEFEAMLARHDHVKRIVCGHLHRAIETTFAGITASSCPSPAHQVALDLHPDGRDDFVMEPPGYQLHRWMGDRFVTHTVLVGDFGRRYPFREQGILID
jgi:3',5'-cyclic-AMP phosphodiesterase